MISPCAAFILFGMPGLGEWVLIIIAILVLFGGTKLPALGKGLGEGIRNFRDALKGSPKNDKPEAIEKKPEES